MVARSLVLGGGQNSGSEVLGVIPVLPWLVASFVLCCRVAMVAVLELRSPATKDACARWISCELKDIILKKNALDTLKLEVAVGLGVHLALPLFISVKCRRGLPLSWVLSDWILPSTTPGFHVSSHPSINQCCSSLVAIVSSSFLLLQVYCIIAKSEKNNFTWDQLLLEIWLVKMIFTVVILISPSPVSCATLLIPQVNDKSMETGKPILEMDVLLHELTYLHHLSVDTPKLSMISICGYTNLEMYQIYMEITESVTWSIGLAAQSLKIFNWNHPSCVNQWSEVGMTVTFLQHYYVHTQQSPMNGSPVGPIEQDYITGYCCTSSHLIDGIHVEDIVPWLFGLCHRRWTAAPSLLILRFNSGDSLFLSLVKDIPYLQLKAHKPQVHTPDRPLGESTTGHQLVWSTKEALKDCSCSKFEPELSSDKRPLFDSSCSLRHGWRRCDEYRRVVSKTFGSEEEGYQSYNEYAGSLAMCYVKSYQLLLVIRQL